MVKKCATGDEKVLHLEKQNKIPRRGDQWNGYTIKTVKEVARLMTASSVPVETLMRS